MPSNQIQVGPQNTSDGSPVTARGGRQGDTVVSQLHGRYYEQTFRGNVYTDGMTLTSISNAIWNFSATTDATIKGITGLWNPTTSGINCVILQAFLGVTVTAATCTGGGPYVWVKSSGESALTLGTAPINLKSLTTTGPNGASNVKGLSGIAQTGKVNAVTFLRASSLCGGSSGNFSFVGTAAGQFTPQVTSIELIDGMIIVPPGGVLALMATSTAVAHSAAAGIVWEEVPI